MTAPQRQRGECNKPPARAATRAGGFTLVEILLATTIAALLIIFLAQILNTSSRTWAIAQRDSDAYAEARGALSALQNDLSGAFGFRPANLPKIRENITDEQEAFFEDRLFLPFEVSRQSGISARNSFRNGEPPTLGFSQLAFALTEPPSRHPDPALNAYQTDMALAGYYVAFTRDSPIASARSSMKLHRHFRPSGDANARGAAYARNVILYLNQTLNQYDDESPLRPTPQEPALVRRGLFQNKSLPLLLSHHVNDWEALSSIPAMDPWPKLPPMNAGGTSPNLPFPPSVFPPPSRNEAGAQNDPTHPMHQFLPADEPVARNVVRFECTPYKWIEGTPQNPRARPFAAQELNAYLGLPGTEWPVLVTPDYIDITLGVVSDETAAKLLNYEDWFFDWSNPVSGDGSWKRRLVNQSMRTFHSRVYVGHSP